MERFIIIPNKLVKEGILSNGAILLLGCLYSNSKKLGYAYATNKYYAYMIGCSVRTVTYLIKELNDHNYIRIENPKSFKRKIYVNYKFPSSKKEMSMKLEDNFLHNI